MPLQSAIGHWNTQISYDLLERPPVRIESVDKLDREIDEE